MNSEDRVTASNQAPAWLPLMPFLASQWSVIEDLLVQFPHLNNYDLQSDWQQFISGHPHLDVFARLRRFRQSRLAFFAYQDLFLPLKNHTETMLLVSQLADFLLKQAWLSVNDDMLKRYGTVKNQNGEAASLQVFALGKLGTCELNYSSDIDLVFVHDGQGSSDGERSIDAESWFTRFGKKLIQLLDSFTQDGRVYQVDMRLRPFGSAGPLVCSNNALIQYLINEGRDWERFAWMRARLVCGNQQSVKELLREIDAFIYRRHLDYKVFDALAKIKKDIAFEHQVHEHDLKLGSGGIRTIEFVIQSLQVVFGGRNQQLKGVSICPQFELLLHHKKITEDNAVDLEHAWLKLRKLENMAQIVHDQAIHELPQDPELQTLFAELMDAGDWSGLLTDLNRSRQAVDLIFSEIFKQPETPKHQLKSAQQQLLQELIEALNLTRVPQDTAQKAEQLLELTIEKANKEVCHDFAAIVKILLKRPSYLLMLLKEQNVHQNVLLLLSKDKFFKDILVRFPVLLEQLFEYQPFKALTVKQLTEDWRYQAIHESDTEQWMEQLRYFKLQNLFNLMRFYTANEINDQTFRRLLTVLAEFILLEVVKFSHREIQRKFDQVSIGTSDLMVIAYGSMAIWNMKASSDLDLVFVLDKQQIAPDERLFLQRWIKRIMHHLNSQMYHGLLYEIDLQLRPNGNSGPLVTTRHEFEQYQRHDAWIWEHAAMIKSRLVYGTEEQRNWHQQFRQSILCQPREAAKVDIELQRMAEKLAEVKGEKNHEADFQLLGAVLKHANSCPELAEIHDFEVLKARVNEI